MRRAMGPAFPASLAVLVAVTAAAQEPVRPDATFAPLDARELDTAAVAADRRALIAQALGAGAYERAQTMLVEEVTRNPQAPELLRLLGAVRFMQREYLGAAVAFKKAEVLAPLDERSRFTLAMSYVVLGRRDWARPELQKLSQSAPRNPLYRYWTARLDYDDGKYAAAADGLVHVIALDPRFVKAHDNLGLCYDALGRYDDAIRSYQEAVRLNREGSPGSPWPPLNLGVLLSRLDRQDEAEPLFREAVRLDPRLAQGHYQLGTALEKKGRAEEAVSELEEAARLDASYAEPHYALARLYRRRGDAAKADRALERFLALKKEKGQAGGPP
ncbi:MAG TPA: tetratricopeptide repeat protein [Vicinamibacteria bacterium]